MASVNALPSDPAGELAAAEVARQRLTGGLRLPTWFHTSLGVAAAVQIGTAAYGIAGQGPPGPAVPIAASSARLLLLGVDGCRWCVDPPAITGVVGTPSVSRGVVQHLGPWSSTGTACRVERRSELGR